MADAEGNAELNTAIVESVANEEFKAIASIPGSLANMTMQNMVNSQHNIQSVTNKSLANSLASMDRIGMTEAISVGSLQSKDVASLMLTLISALGGSQIATKSAQSTPPETAQ